MYGDSDRHRKSHSLTRLRRVRIGGRGSCAINNVDAKKHGILVGEIRGGERSCQSNTSISEVGSL